jgi:hypothetical protein
MRIAIVIFTLMGALSASAQETKQGVGVIGLGNSSCGVWTSSRSGQDALSLMTGAGAQGWVHGYITAMSVESDRINAATHRTDPKGLDAWIDNWCRANPLRSIAKAAEALAIELDK